MAPLQQQLGASSCSPAGKPTASGPRAQPSTFQCCATPRCAVQCQETLCNGMLCCAVPRNVVQRHAALLGARKCHTMPCCTTLRHAVHAVPCSAVERHKTLHLFRNFPLHAHQPQPPGTHVLFLPLQVLLCPCSSSADRSTRASGPANW